MTLSCTRPPVLHTGPRAVRAADPRVAKVELPEAFYLPAGDGRYLATRATESPWDVASQHGGPPAALLATCIEQAGGGPDRRLSRMTLEFLGPVPRRECQVETHVARPGRRVAMTEAVMSFDGKSAVLARAWHIAVETEQVRPVPPALSRAGIPELPPQAGGHPLPLRPEWGYGMA